MRRVQLIARRNDRDRDSDEDRRREREREDERRKFIKQAEVQKKEEENFFYCQYCRTRNLKSRFSCVSCTRLVATGTKCGTCCRPVNKEGILNGGIRYCSSCGEDFRLVGVRENILEGLPQENPADEQNGNEDEDTE